MDNQTDKNQDFNYNSLDSAWFQDILDKAYANRQDIQLRQIRLRSKVQALFQRIDELEAKLQALKKGSKAD